MPATIICAHADDRLRRCGARHADAAACRRPGRRKRSPFTWGTTARRHRRPSRMRRGGMPCAGWWSRSRWWLPPRGAATRRPESRRRTSGRTDTGPGSPRRRSAPANQRPPCGRATRSSSSAATSRPARPTRTASRRPNRRLDTRLRPTTPRSDTWRLLADPPVSLGFVPACRRRRHRLPPRGRRPGRDSPPWLRREGRPVVRTGAASRRRGGLVGRRRPGGRLPGQPRERRRARHRLRPDEEHLDAAAGLAARLRLRPHHGRARRPPAGAARPRTGAEPRRRAALALPGRGARPHRPVLAAAAGLRGRRGHPDLAALRRPAGQPGHRVLRRRRGRQLGPVLPGRRHPPPGHGPVVRPAGERSATAPAASMSGRSPVTASS